MAGERAGCELLLLLLLLLPSVRPSPAAPCRQPPTPTSLPCHPAQHTTHPPELCMLSMAAAASSGASNSTKPKPRCCPVAWSMGSDTSLMSPKGMKAECSALSLTVLSRPPTYSAVLGLEPLPPLATVVDCRREGQEAGGGRQGVAAAGGGASGGGALPQAAFQRLLMLTGPAMWGAPHRGGTIGSRSGRAFTARPQPVRHRTLHHMPRSYRPQASYSELLFSPASCS